MSQAVSISEQEIIQQLKISRQVPTILREIKIRHLIRDTANSQGVILDEAELQQAADSFRLQHNLIGAQATFDWLNKYSLSTDDFEALIQAKVLATKLAHHLFSEKIEAYFHEHQLDYTKAAIYEIILKNFDLAIELFYGIQEREFSFWDLAHQYIDDRELRCRGGYRGLLTRDRLKPEISAAVFVAQPPQVLKPILIDKQAHLIYVEEIIQPTLDDKLHHQIINNLFEQWIEEKLLNDDRGDRTK